MRFLRNLSASSTPAVMTTKTRRIRTKKKIYHSVMKRFELLRKKKRMALKIAMIKLMYARITTVIIALMRISRVKH